VRLLLERDDIDPSIEDGSDRTLLWEAASEGARCDSAQLTAGLDLARVVRARPKLSFPRSAPLQPLYSRLPFQIFVRLL
jgi:hypothetical protein